MGVATGLAASVFAAATPAGGAPKADPGISKDEIAIGYPTVLSGPAASIVKNIPIATQAYIDDLNENNDGINGRKIKAVVEDAGSQDAAAASAALTKLKDESFLIITSDGTIFGPLAARFKLPSFYAFSSEAAGLNNKYGFMVQTYAAYQAEKLLPDYLINELDAKNKKIAVIYQPDGFTAEANDAFIKAAKKKKLDVVIDQPIDGAAATCAQEVANVAGEKPDITVVIALRSALCAFREMEAQALQTSVTGVGGTYGINIFLTLAPKLLEGSTMLGTFPPISNDPNDECSAEYIEIMKRQEPDKPELLTDEAAYSGFLITRNAVKQLEKAGNFTTREGLVKKLAKTKNFDDGCLPPVSYGPGDKRQGANSVNVWQVENTKFVLKDGKYKTTFK